MGWVKRDICGFEWETKQRLDKRIEFLSSGIIMGRLLYRRCHFLQVHPLRHLFQFPFLVVAVVNSIIHK
jgi:hypothetical protein